MQQGFFPRKLYCPRQDAPLYVWLQHTEEEFLPRYWEQNPLLIATSRGRRKESLAGLFSFAKLQAIEQARSAGECFLIFKRSCMPRWIWLTGLSRRW